MPDRDEYWQPEIEVVESLEEAKEKQGELLKQIEEL